MELYCYTFVFEDLSTNLSALVRHREQVTMAHNFNSGNHTS